MDLEGEIRRAAAIMGLPADLLPHTPITFQEAVVLAVATALLWMARPTEARAYIEATRGLLGSPVRRQRSIQSWPVISLIGLASMQRAREQLRHFLASWCQRHQDNPLLLTRAADLWQLAFTAQAARICTCPVCRLPLLVLWRSRHFWMCAPCFLRETPPREPRDLGNDSPPPRRVRQRRA
jgi:hypothetical protein